MFNCPWTQGIRPDKRGRWVPGSIKRYRGRDKIIRIAALNLVVPFGAVYVGTEIGQT